MLTASGVYAATLVLMVTGFNMTSRSIDAPNYSIGAVMAIGMFATNYLVRTMDVFPYLAMPVGVMVCGVLNWLCFVLVFRPLMKRGRGPILTAVASIGLMILLIAVGQILDYFRRSEYHYPSMLFAREYDFYLFGMPFVFVFSTLISIGMIFVTRRNNSKRFGVVLRSLGENIELAQVQGVDYDKINQILWVFSGCLLGLAGGIHPLTFHSSVSMGPVIMNSVIAASLVGWEWGACGGILGGILVGFLEIMGTTVGQHVIGPWFGEYRIFFPIIVIALVLCYRSYWPGKKNQEWS